MTTPAAPVRPTSLVSGLNHVAIITGDLERLAAFYARVFDAETFEVPAPPGTARAVVVQFTGRAGLALVEERGNPHAAGSTVGLTRGHIDHVALDAPTADSLEGIRRRLVAAGASDGVVNDYGPMLSVHFVDPDGMGCEVCWMRDPASRELHPPRPFEGSLIQLDDA